MPALANYALTGDPFVDSLLGEAKWAVTDFSFSFPTSASYYGSNYGSDEPGDNFGTLNATQKAVVENALSMYASVSSLTFTEIAETSFASADLRFAMSDAPSTAWAYFPSTSAEGGDSWFNNSSKTYDNPVKGNYANLTFLHEIGHALGLEHAHDSNVMPADRDSLEYTVMSYRSYVDKPLNQGYSNETFGYPQSLMMYDIAALQHLYGADYVTNAGDTTYSWSATTGEMFIDGAGQGAPGADRIFLTIWDGGGCDTYDFSNYTTDLDVNLSPGAWTTTSASQLAELHYNGSEIAAGNIANALLFDNDWRALIENAIGGAGDDFIFGNSTANRLCGNAGDDELRGGFGRDTLVGGASSDLLYGGAGNDSLFGGAGNDSLFGGAGHDSLVGGNGNDRLSGHAGDDLLLGGDQSDQLFGCQGNDLLQGDGGADLLVGGAGRDSFVFRAVSDSTPGAFDTIQDFLSGTDMIDLQEIDADFGMGGSQSFTFLDDALFSRHAGQLNFRNELVSGDVDGDGLADFQIHLVGVSVLTETDFIL